jgi:hypothetical protein
VVDELAHGGPKALGALAQFRFRRMDRGDGAMIVDRRLIGRKTRRQQPGSVERGHGADSFQRSGRIDPSTSSS